MPLFLFATILNLSLIIAMLIWKPYPLQPVALFIIAALWGLADAVWQTQVNCKFNINKCKYAVQKLCQYLCAAFYGYIFPRHEEAAFSNHRLWESIGFIIAYAYGTFICVNAKLYVLLGVLISGIIGYLVIEYQESRKPKKEG